MLADIRTRPSVRADVDNQMRLLSERFVTLGTFVGLFLSVCAHVRFEMCTLDKTFVTLVTLVGFLSRVCTLVDQ